MLILQLIIIFLLILCVGFFTSSETAYLSLPKLKVRAMLDEKKPNAKIVAKLKANMDRLLTTVLIGTNLLNSLTAALVTALVLNFSSSALFADLTPFITAFFITTFGQIVPKTAAALNPVRFTSFASLPLFLLEKIFFPVVWLFEKLSGLVVKLAEKVISPANSQITEEEVKALIDVGEKEGIIEKDESKMLNKIISFNDLQVDYIMKHRSFVASVDYYATKEEVIAEFNKSGFSTLTVYKDNIENVVGVINYRSVLYGSDREEDDEENSAGGYVADKMEEVLYVPETFSVLELLNKFREDENKFAIVLDEQGQTSGIVTMKDIMKLVFERMTDENSYDNLPAEDKIKLVNYNTFIVPGELKIEDVNRALNLSLHSEDFNTLGGWLLEQFGYLPSVGNALVYKNIIFTAEDISQRRIVSVKIKV